MTQNKNSKHLPLLFKTIFFVGFCLLLLFCTNPNNFERDINFDNGWERINNPKPKDKQIRFRKNFKVNVNENKIYILELTSPENVLQLKMNNSVIPGNRITSNEINYNLTDLLRINNTIELNCKNINHFDARLHCVNKLFIPDINFEMEQFPENKKIFLFEVKIKNAFDEEKQAYLEYTIFDKNNKKLQTKETPVFIAGNSENRYQQKINFEDLSFETTSFKVECRLFTDGNLQDFYCETYNPENKFVEQILK